MRYTRKVKSDAPDYKNLLFTPTKGGPSVEMWWRKADMPAPSIETSWTASGDVEHWEIAVECLEAAIAEAKAWMARPPWGKSIG